MSCFCRVRSLGGRIKAKRLAPAYEHLQETARAIATIEMDCRIPDVDVEAYVKRFQPNMMDITFAWANGASFEELTTMTTALESSIIQIFRLLEELMRQMAAAPKSLDDDRLDKKFNDGIKAIKHGVLGTSIM